MSVLDTLQRLRRNYGSTMTDDECVALCNDTAWVHRSEGYGVSHKAGGTHGTRYDGEPCCHDVLMMQDGRYWDVLISAGGVSIPTWGAQPSGVITDPSRYWVAPIAPQGSVDPPIPPPTTTLEARVAELEAWRASVGRVTMTQG